jgi:hydrogenase expression/formation protein HypD
MKYIDEFRDTALGRGLIEHISQTSKHPISLMEFCGGHTAAIMKNGLRQLLPSHIHMLSGPGCPVCVTSVADIDRAIALSLLPDVIITTFGDMLKIPGSHTSLQAARAEGADIRIVYSIQDALHIAGQNPQKSVIFLGIGFETTAPTIAAAVLEARQKNLQNFYVLPLLKLCPPAVRAILELGEVKLQGIIGPGHVCAILGTHPFAFIQQQHGIGLVVAGFEALDILQAVAMLVEQAEKGQPQIEIAYRRGVKPQGNKVALELMQRVFQEADADWRGLGILPHSGLKFQDEYSSFDAAIAFPVQIEPAMENKGCICGEILRGIKTPAECPLFRRVCAPENPVGPCMVSAEGSCSAHYLYGDLNA